MAEPRIYWHAPLESVHRITYQEGRAAVTNTLGRRVGYRMYTIRQDIHDRGYYHASGHGWVSGGRDPEALRAAAEQAEQELFARLGY
jgi:hypothetical protein